MISHAREHPHGPWEGCWVWPQQQRAVLDGQRRRGGMAARSAVLGLPDPHSCNCGACSFCISNGETQMVTAECKTHLLKSAADCSP